MRRQKLIRAFDLFCGGGGSSLGAEQAGATVAGGADLWPVATDAYSLNLGGARTYTADLNDLDPRQVESDVGPIDLLLASPECTHHSVAKGNKPRSEKSKQLAYEVIRFAKQMQPRWIVVENVIQMRKWGCFPDWLSQLELLGYRIAIQTLQAARFGVAQTRRRLFVICDRTRPPNLPSPRSRKRTTIEHVIEIAAPGPWSYGFTPLKNGRRAEKTIQRAERAIAAVGANVEFIMVYYGSDGAGGFQTMDRPLRTITTLDRFALVRPNCVGHEMRMLQPAELAVAMGFPRKYRFPESATRRDCVKLIGNAVCPPVMRAVIEALLKSR